MLNFNEKEKKIYDYMKARSYRDFPLVEISDILYANQERPLLWESSCVTFMWNFIKKSAAMDSETVMRSSRAGKKAVYRMEGWS